MSSNFRPKCLVFDLEVVPPKEGQTTPITMLGALRPDTDKELELKVKQVVPALEQLDALAEGASFVLGHNLIAHDLPVLREYMPKMALYALPAVDTLLLSPLAFPENPYHRLIKDYKLIRDSLNSPLSDCRTTLTLFYDQREAFNGLKAEKKQELLCYQALLAPDQKSALWAFFVSVVGSTPLPLSELPGLIRDLLKESDASLGRNSKVCQTRLQRLLYDDLCDSELHWPIAYVLAWLRVSGGNSVLAPWVRYQFPEVSRLIAELRDTPCGESDCQYCDTTHNPRSQLQHYFGFNDFRYESPGQSLQHDIVLAGMRGKNVLAVLATGGGKSLCYQLPALNRYRRNGSLTVIVSPLQSLMKDQVDGLLAHNIQCAAALNGLLTMPERGDVLDKIQMGDIGLLFVSPEQFRNKAFRRVIRHRQVGGWVYDEAHCLSKWGSDFRPDYLYVSRFISEYSADGALAPIACFTATAKLDVLADIKSHFKQNLAIDFSEFLGGHERLNLHFDVLPCPQAEKRLRTEQLLREHLNEQDGGAVVFSASRKKAEELAEFLIDQGWSCRYFHAGLEPNAKTDIQDDFISGELRVIVATNAFGMGVDKADIRLVVHADIPGSLENYLQEAGRAGRDQEDAHCVLLYDAQDIETQFAMSEQSKLTLRDIQQILRKLRNESGKRKEEKLVITAGEILQDDSVDTSFAANDRHAETKVVTAVAWLERGKYLKREENHTQIFPARLVLKAEDAEKCIEKANLPVRRLEEYRTILRYLYASKADERVNTDALMQLTSLSSEEVTGILKQLEALGVLVNDTQITLYLRHRIAGASEQRLRDSLQLEQALFSCLQEQAPDADAGEWQDVNLSLLTTTLRQETQQEGLLSLHVLRLLRSLSDDQDGKSEQRSSFEIRQINREYLKLRIRGGLTWQQVNRLGEKRRVLADKMLQFLLAKLPDKLRGKDLLVETTFGELIDVIASDLELRHQVPLEQRHKAVEHVLLYLHRQTIIALNHGMTVMRRAMGIEINGEKRGTFKKEDYLQLDAYYRERRIQVHVMREYAEIALKEMADALRFVLHYFTDTKQTFSKRYFAGREEILKLATSEKSWRLIIGTLNPQQKRIVADDDDHNRLVLAGPGSGKTRVIVHRIAYLLRVRQVPANSIVALTFNRHAANEIRQRLLSLLGSSAYGVSVLTYHSMAMRLTGTRFDSTKLDDGSLQQVLADAVELLEGKRIIEGEDDLREQLLRGYRYILVDEYQDIDEMQYRLVSALAGKHAEEEGRLCIMAVGDDDQNIYAWRETNNQYIERFKQDYQAHISYLTDNYRSSDYIIGAANQIISHNPQRLKKEHPIHINAARQHHAPGGMWQTLDALRQGRVLRLQLQASLTASANVQAQAAMEELQRLLSLSSEGVLDWQSCAVLARSHRYLWPVQAWCEKHGIRYFLAADKESELPIIRQRSFMAVIDDLRLLEGAYSAAEIFSRLIDRQVILDEEWQQFFETAFDQLRGELGECQLSSSAIIDWLYEYARELRRQPKQGLYLGTVHSAKGLEFPHVVLLDGGWAKAESSTELADERRLYYVGMTRAEQSLTLCEFADGNPFSPQLSDPVQQRQYKQAIDTTLNVRYQQLSMKEIDIGYAGRQAGDAEIHQAIGALREGDSLSLQESGGRYLLLDSCQRIVGRTAKAFAPQQQVEHCEVAAVLVRFAEEGDPQYKHQCQRWEIVIPRCKGRSVI